MFYGWIIDGVFKNADELAAGPVFRLGSTIASRVGDTRFLDISEPDGKLDGIIDGVDQIIMGSPYPDFYSGMTNQFSYRNMSLNVNLQVYQGNKVLSVARQGRDLEYTRARSATNLI